MANAIRPRTDRHKTVAGRSPPRATPMNVIINGRQARRAGRTRRNLDGPSTPADRTRPTRYAGWHDQPTPKALQRVPRDKSRVIGTPPRVRSIADRTNPVSVRRRATMTHAGHVRLCNSRALPVSVFRAAGFSLRGFSPLDGLRMVLDPVYENGNCSRAHPRYQCRQRAACKPAHSTGEICASRSL